MFSDKSNKRGQTPFIPLYVRSLLVSSNKRGLSPFITFILATLLTACSEVELVGIQVDSIDARVELAYTAEARRQGLMRRQQLGRDEGMLFVFPQEKVLEMWMLNVQIPLDVGFFDRTGRLLGWRSMGVDGGMAIYESTAPALYALEMNQGWFERYPIALGAKLRLPFPVEAR